MGTENKEKLNIFDLKLLNSFTESYFKIKPNFNLVTFLAKKERIDFIYNTSALEGNPMTFPEVQTLLEGITVGGHKLSDEQQILNQNKSVQLLYDMVEKKDFTIDKSTFCKLHHKVAFEEALNWGKFRTGQIRIGGTEFKPPVPGNLDSIFQNGLEILEEVDHPIVKALSFFLFGAINQFFWDGNKRTSRLMMNGILLSSGFPILNIKAKDKLEFNTKMVAYYDSQKMEDILNYLVMYYLKQNK
ncbi:MAG: Fic family protein [Candidatus Cloacimonetes bacterium]|nr:Fic family protein [Candidatus Cloacimonadota bacterium]